MKKQVMAPQTFIERVRPMLDGLFHTALLITDNLTAAEAAVQESLLYVYLHGDLGSRNALFGQLSRAVRRIAFVRLQEQSLSPYESGDWQGISGMSVVDDPLLSTLCGLLAQEELPVQRCILLLYGCGLSLARAAEAAGMDISIAREAVARFRSRTAGTRTDAFERSLTQLCRRVLARGTAAHDVSAVCRAFERDAVTALRGRRKRRINVAGILLAGVGILLCMFLFWLMAVLLEPGTAPNVGRLPWRSL